MNCDQNDTKNDDVEVEDHVKSAAQLELEERMRSSAELLRQCRALRGA